MRREELRREIVSITDEVCVSVIYYKDGTCECAVMTKWFARDNWEIEEDYVKAENNLSPMEVYGYIEHQVKPAYLDQ